ncbi:MAG TPA: nicotinate phosphoribosyltransferase [Chloroflexota bacterium]|nr:nicotinate phosphoribosyltransferase [Chloroflexota bacterium]
MATPPPALLLDLYELTMAQSYVDEGMTAPATFSLFARHLPRDWGYLVAAGLDDVLSYLETLAFGAEELSYLRSTGLFTPTFLDHLGRLRFTGSVRAMPEGTVCFPNEPLLEVTAPIVEAQLVESAIVNQVHFQTLIASKAARCVEAAVGRRLVDFGLRRTHGYDAGLKAARSAYLVGFDATSNVLAGQRYGIPIAGTMAHSYVEAFGDEAESFRAFVRAYPDGTTLLVDTYDTVRGIERAAAVGRELAAAGHRLGGVRLDSGDLGADSAEARRILDAAGLTDATIFVSGNLDEHTIAALLAAGAPIDGFGVGTRMGVSADAPYLDMAYKLVAYDGRPTLKTSAGKATWPGPKQVWRRRDARGPADLVALAAEPGPAEAEPLLLPAMADGRRTGTTSLAEVRARARAEIERLAPEQRRLTAPAAPSVGFSAELVRLRDALTARVSPRPPQPAVV